MSRQAYLLSLLVLLLSACYGGRHRAAVALLDEADSLNRAYAPLPPDSLLQAVARFLDRHGSPDEQVRAHYLLGCALRDQGRAPEALQAYQDAIDRADTLHGDLHRLMAVYGQMAELYDKQNLPQDELEVANAYGRCALMAKDTFGYIRNLELMAKPYYLLRDTTRMYEVLETARHLYEQHGMKQQALSVLALNIHQNVERGKYDEAKMQMDIFETQSGLFDANGNISPDRISYYYTKGLYYLGLNLLDSAEVMMRRVLPYRNVDGSKGLLSVYSKRGDVDSVMKYVSTYEAAFDSLTTQRRMEIIHQMASLYNYQRVKSKADHQALVASRKNALLLFVSVISLFALVVLAFFYRLRSKESAIAYKNYLANVERLKQVQAEILQYRRHEEEYQEIIEVKQHQVRNLEERIGHYESQHNNTMTAEERFERSEALMEFKNKVQSKGYTLLDDDFARLEKALFDCFPEFKRFVESHRADLTDKERKVIVLIRAHFMVKVIASLLNIRVTSISHMRSDLMQKLFHTEGNSRDFDHKINNIC